MFTVNLEKRLIKENDYQLIEARRILKEASEADIQILSSVGLSNTQNLRAKFPDLELYETGRVFTLGQIKKTAIKYGLRFLPTRYYAGTVPSNLPSSIREFKKKYKSTDYYILAPADSFQLQSVPKDPLLFAKLDGNSYYLIRKWGNDLSIFRWVTNLHKRNERCRITYNALKYLVPAILFIVTTIFFAMKANGKDLNTVAAIVSGVLGLFLSIIGAFNVFDGNIYSWEREDLNENKWDKTYEYQ